MSSRSMTACASEWFKARATRTASCLTLVLHTWTQDLQRHLRVHALMACGALSHDAQGNPSWQPPRRSPTFLFSVQALSQVFNGKFITALQQAQASGRLRPDLQANCAQRFQAIVLPATYKQPLADQRHTGGGAAFKHCDSAQSTAPCVQLTSALADWVGMFSASKYLSR
jgi:Putative transposase